jgi:hypothetical protein
MTIAPSQPHCIALRNGNPAMPRGRHPDGEHALSNAERQVRDRARHEADQPAPVVRYWRPVDRRSRLKRWHDAVAGLLALQAEYAAWWDALPDSLRDSATAEALQAISMNSPPSCHCADTGAIDGHIAAAPPRTAKKFSESRSCRLTNTSEE